ncbi:MAG: hypothetical protein GY940_28020, partial [bacterium]|nr:hypothetical protein [bacterium]
YLEGGITFKYAFLTMNEVIFVTGILLMIVLLFSLIVYFSIKKKSDYMMDEMDNLLNLTFKTSDKN